MFKLIEKDEDDQFKLKVVKKEQLTHDTYLIRLEFPNPEWIAGLWAGGHYTVHSDIGDKHIVKRYTPISPVNQKGFADFAIKVYRNNEQFPNGGVFTQHLEKNINVGDMMTCEGPIGMLRYLGWGKFVFKKVEMEHKKTNVFLIAGGSGITPMLAIAQASVLANDGVKMTLIFCNKTKDDILCDDVIKDLEKKGDNFKVFNSLTRHDESKQGAWDGLTGRISYDMMKKCGLPAEVSDDILVASCGPSGFGDTISAFLGENGFVKGNHFN